jgi:hypothetical protein
MLISLDILINLRHHYFDNVTLALAIDDLGWKLTTKGYAKKKPRKFKRNFLGLSFVFFALFRVFRGHLPIIHSITDISKLS